MELVPHFTGREEELARLSRWAADPEVGLIGVTAWGGAGKTALVTRWVHQGGGGAGRSVFSWSFYADASAEHWADAVLEWVEQQYGVNAIVGARPAAALLHLLQELPLLLVLDGLESVQEGPVGDWFGRLLDGTLREVLTGACRAPLAGLVVLTSRFPFADLEMFDGSAARMLEVPPFTRVEGSALLMAAGGNWLAEKDRQDLVAAVDGHALAVWVLAGLLADHLPSSELEALRGELASATRTDARVGRVLRFYAARLAEPDRYLIAGVSLFTHPVSPAAVLAIAEHPVFGGRVAGWTSAHVEAAVRDRLTGLLALHLDGTLSAHPLVRDAFRPLVMDAAQVAANTTLTGLPGGQVASRPDALRVVEAIELLLDAEQWQPADELYRGRSGDGILWHQLPAARLGQRAASAFCSPARRHACSASILPDRLGFYFNEAGLFALVAGDVATAWEYLPSSIQRYREMNDRLNISKSLQNLTECLGHLGDAGSARETASEALAYSDSRPGLTRTGLAYLGWAAWLSGDTLEADKSFMSADCIEFSGAGRHLYSLRGVRWAELMARTGRICPARVLTDRNRDICDRSGWNQDVALCDRLLGRLDLVAGDHVSARKRLAAAAACFRDGDYLIELTGALTDLAESARAAGDLEIAGQHATEAISIAAPRRLVPAQSAALISRASIYADLASSTEDPSHIARGRDAAEAARRLATRGHFLPWCELDALRSHARLDESEGTDHGWSHQADSLYSRLVPAGLDPDPLATAERQVEYEKRSEHARDGTMLNFW